MYPLMISWREEETERKKAASSPQGLASESATIIRGSSNITENILPELFVVHALTLQHFHTHPLPTIWSLCPSTSRFLVLPSATSQSSQHSLQESSISPSVDFLFHKSFDSDWVGAFPSPTLSLFSYLLLALPLIFLDRCLLATFAHSCISAISLLKSWAGPVSVLRLDPHSPPPRSILLRIFSTVLLLASCLDSHKQRSRFDPSP